MTRTNEMNLLPWMERWGMLPPAGGTVLVAVSGGRDSVCLLHYLARLGTARGFSVAAAHLDHGQRPTAARDVAFVQSLCRTLDVPCHVGRADVPALARELGVGVEEAGRRARYEFLERTADEIGAARIATAHHAGDQAETVLLHLLRGAGTRGLRGIPPVRGRVVRPLLQTTRAEIEAYLEKNHLGHVEDETNADTTLRRNFLRLELMPQIERFQPGTAANLCRAAELLRAEDDYLDGLARSRLPDEGTRVPCGTLRDAPEVLRTRMVRLLLERLGAGQRDFTAAHYEAMTALALSEKDSLLHLPGGVRAEKRGDVWALRYAPPPLPQTALPDGSAVRWGDYTITLRKKTEKSFKKSDAIRLNCDKINQSLTVRPWRGSDRLRLPGARGARSLKRLFADAGVPAAQRERIPVLCAGERPLAAYGIGTDADFLPEPGGPVLIIEIDHTEDT